MFVVLATSQRISHMLGAKVEILRENEKIETELRVCRDVQSNRK